MILIVGPGGNGQTYFMNFLINNNININDVNDNDNLKHLSSPNNLKNIDIEKCIFLYNHPYNCFMSHYRRNWGYCQSCKLGNPNYFSNEMLNNFDLVKTLTIQNNKDIFGIEFQFNNWINIEKEFPILFLDFNEILMRKNIINIFLGKELNYDIFNIKIRSFYDIKINKEIYEIYDKLYKNMKEQVKNAY
jgi:hypothetical protein